MLALASGSRVCEGRRRASRRRVHRSEDRLPVRQRESVRRSVIVARSLPRSVPVPGTGSRIRSAPWSVEANADIIDGISLPSVQSLFETVVCDSWREITFKVGKLQVLNGKTAVRLAA